jgi:hypothetical protein
MESRVRLTGDNGEPWILRITGGKLELRRSEEPHDVELIGATPVLRAVIARPRHAFALFVLGRLRVRGKMAHIDALSELFEGANHA